MLANNVNLRLETLKNLSVNAKPKRKKKRKLKLKDQISLIEDYLIPDIIA